MKTKQFWYPLPERLIAQHPADRRGTEKMMVLHRATGVIEHRHIADIAEYLTQDDLLVVNDTKVFPARLIGTWADSPGAVEVLMVNPAAGAIPEEALAKNSVVWNVMLGSGRPCREGQTAVFGPCKELAVTLAKPLGCGMWQAVFKSDRPLNELLDAFGKIPVPPYVKREGTAEEEKEDRLRYQTIYARHIGSVAAPTAGLHFTPEIFAALEAKGVRRVAVTLHVGPGTFRPVKAENIEDHVMDFEAFTIPPETADAINETKAKGGRIVCVGSTTVRTLETVAARDKKDGEPLIAAGSGASNIFIYPPYEFRATDAMLTNFHLPQSTLLMMTSALAGRERMLCAYAFAVRKEYKFFSYGDCMLIL
ncbi:MAG: tRNA preQ1(34) S-adenosylmethionine ribosyltransferase-isomerase QueA [Kiritimatiellae bacterium]|nr:tRNA preQ1(34) S-adenosylmethionine ribosyltransferase-isomerase QueA [Kiritimatiellia bacterium]